VCERERESVCVNVLPLGAKHLAIAAQAAMAHPQVYMYIDTYIYVFRSLGVCVCERERDSLCVLIWSII